MNGILFGVSERDAARDSQFSSPNERMGNQGKPSRYPQDAWERPDIDKPSRLPGLAPNANNRRAITSLDYRNDDIIAKSAQEWFRDDSKSAMGGYYRNDNRDGKGSPQKERRDIQNYNEDRFLSIEGSIRSLQSSLENKIEEVGHKFTAESKAMHKVYERDRGIISQFAARISRLEEVSSRNDDRIARFEAYTGKVAERVELQSSALENLKAEFNSKNNNALEVAKDEVSRVLKHVRNMERNYRDAYLGIESSMKESELQLKNEFQEKLGSLSSIQKLGMNDFVEEVSALRNEISTIREEAEEAGLTTMAKAKQLNKVMAQDLMASQNNLASTLLSTRGLMQSIEAELKASMETLEMDTQKKLKNFTETQLKKSVALEWKWTSERAAVQENMTMFQHNFDSFKKSIGSINNEFTSLKNEQSQQRQELKKALDIVGSAATRLDSEEDARLILSDRIDSAIETAQNDMKLFQASLEEVMTTKMTASQQEMSERAEKIEKRVSESITATTKKQREESSDAITSINSKLQAMQSQLHADFESHRVLSEAALESSKLAAEALKKDSETSLENMQRQLSEEMSSLSDAIAKQLAESQEALNAETEALSEAQENLTANLTTVATAIDTNLKELKADLEQTIEQVRNDTNGRFTELQKFTDETKQSITDTENVIKGMEEKLAMLSTQSNDQSAGLDDFKQSLSDLATEVSAASEARNSDMSRLDTVTRELDEKLEAAKVELQQVASTASEATTQNAALTETVKGLEAQLAAKEQETKDAATDLTEKLEASKTELQQLTELAQQYATKTDIEACTEQYTTLTETVKGLEAQLAAKEQDTGLDEVTKKLEETASEQRKLGEAVANCASKADVDQCLASLDMAKLNRLDEVHKAVQNAVMKEELAEKLTENLVPFKKSFAQMTQEVTKQLSKEMIANKKAAEENIQAVSENLTYFLSSYKKSQSGDAGDLNSYLESY